MAAAVAPMQMMAVVVPAGVEPGQAFGVMTPDGKQMHVVAQVPAGQQMQVQVPSAAAGVQMQPVPTAAAVPMQATRPQQDAVSLFTNVPGVEISTRRSEHDLDGTFNFLSRVGQTQSTMLNPFGIVTATRGAFPITSTADGAPTIATLFVASADRIRGDMMSTILLPDQTVLASWSRMSRPTMVTTGETELPLSVFGAPYGKLQTSTWGMAHTYVDESGSATKPVSRGCFQTKSYMLCAMFLCFIPTCGIGSIIIACNMQKVPGLFDVKTADGSTVALLKFWSMGSDISTSSRMRLEFAEGVDAKTKLSAVLASLFFMADDFISPPNQGGGDAGGAFIGAPDVSVMER